LWFYETTSPMPNVNHVEALDLDVKLAAMACHASQSAQFDYAAMVSGLAMLRGASAGHRAAEAFCRFDWDGSRQNFFEHRPLVSVIVRAEDPELLPLALDSLSAQSYDHLEVVLAGLRLHRFATLRAYGAGASPRSANLNLGGGSARSLLRF
jgi:hypothetical protein